MLNFNDLNSSYEWFPGLNTKLNIRTTYQKHFHFLLFGCCKYLIKKVPFCQLCSKHLATSLLLRPVVWWNIFGQSTLYHITYSYNQNKRHLCQIMKQNCHFDRGLTQYKHATPPLSFSGIITTLLGFPKRYITLVYLKGLKSCK